MVRESVLIKRIFWTAAIVLLSLLLITSPALAESETPPEPAPETETAAADAEPVEGSASEGDQSSAAPEEPAVEEPDSESPVVEPPTEESENSSGEAEDSISENPAAHDEDTPVDLEDNQAEDEQPFEADEDSDDDTQPAGETAEVVEALAEEALTLANGEGGALDLAAQDSAESLSGADPYFYVGSTMYQFLPDGMACPPGTEGSTCWVSDPSDNPIQDAIDYINANGTVPSNRMIYVESGTYTGDVTLDTSTDILSSMINGLIGAGSSTTTIVGDVTIHQNAGGFTLSGFSIEGGLSITESVGTLTLEDLDVSGSDMDGIYVHNQSGNVIVTNTKSSGNDAYGAYIYHEETSGSVTINNSEFNDNGSTLNDFYDVGLYIETAGKVTLEGVSASGNLGRGIEVFDFSALTIYYATANYNQEPYFVDEKGDGIYAFTDKTATVKLENIQANYNADDGIYISTNGSVSAKNIEAQFNTIRTGSIAVQEMVGEYLSADVEYDEWRFEGIIGQDVTVTLETFGGPLDFDPLVRLYDSSYTLLGEDDNTMDGWNATLDYTLPADGVYYVRVYRAFGTQSSRYEMGINYSNTFEDYYERGGSGFTFRTWDGKGILKIQNSFFNENADDGLHVSSRNSVTISTITSTNNGYDGIYVNKSGGDWDCPEGGGACTLLGYSGAGTVTITSPKSTGWLTANAVSGNGGAGIYVFSRGNVSVYNVDAYSNGSGGLNLNTCLGDYYTNFCLGSGNISVGVSIPNWDNYIGENSGIGIKIDSAGSVSLSGTQANYNGMKGVHVDALSSIALKDMEVFHNYDTGAFLSTLASLRARNVTVTDSTFDNNDGTGLIIHTQGTINLKGVSADDNLSPISGTLDSVPISVYDQIYYGDTTEIYYFYGYGGFWLDILLESDDFDAFLELTNNVGDPITFNDNSGGGTDARIIYALPYTGWFQIEVSFVGAEEFGDYILSVNDSDHTVKMYPGSGVELDTTFGSGDIKVYTTRSTPQMTFSENDNFGFYAVSNGRVVIDGVSANRNYRSGLHVESVKNVEVKDKSKYPSATFDENGRYGIYVHTLGSITLYSVSASSNIINGADLENCAYDLDLLECTGSGNITVSMRKKNLAEFSGNGGYGIKAEASRNISIYNASANENGLSGLFLQNYLGLGKVYVQNKNKVPDSTFNDNGGYGILVKSDNYIKLHNVSANSNLYSGAYLDNCRESFGLCFGDGAISITSSKNVLSSFDNNEEHGILAFSLDSFVLTNITANSNGLSGAYLMNNYESSRGIVKIKSSGSVLNQFNDNGGAEDYAGSAPDYRVGLYIETRGKVSISSLEAARTLDGGMSANWYGSPYGGSGMLVSNDNGLDENSLSVTYGTFIDNAMYGMRLLSYGAITMKNIEASSNGFFGAQVANDCEECTDGVTLASTRKGWNTFSNNNGGGLQIDTNGKVILSDVSADNNSLLTGVFYSGGLGTASVGEYYNDALGADVWAFYATAGIPLTIQLDSKWSPSGEVFDPYLELYDDESFLVASDDNSGGVLDAEISFLPTEDGWYYLHASGLFEVDGYYWLAINDPTFADITEMDCDGLSVNTISSVAIKSYAVNTFNNNSRRGLDVLAESHISVQRVNAESNGTDGVSLVNIGGSGNVSVYGQKSSVFSIFNNNKQVGLTIFTNGKVTLRNLWAEYNGLRGIRVGSSGSPAGGTVSLQNIYALDNELEGMEAYTSGLVKATKVHALGNGADGLILDNTAGTAAITLKGDSYFSENGGAGLHLASTYNVTVSKVTANWNVSDGIFLSSDTGRITISKASVTYSGGHGLNITGNDAITLTSVHSKSNGVGTDGDGIHITASATTIMTFKYSSFMTNEGSGIEIVGTLIPPTLSKTYYFGNDTNGSGDGNLDMSL